MSTTQTGSNGSTPVSINESPQPQPQPQPQDNSASDKGAETVKYLRACDNCRRRKVKCDGVRPACAHCQRVGTACHYSIKPKSRRTWKCLETPDNDALASAGANAQDRAGIDETTARLLARVETMERLLMQRSGVVNSPRTQNAQNSAFDDMGSSAVASGALGLRQASVASLSSDLGYTREPSSLAETRTATSQRSDNGNSNGTASAKRPADSDHIVSSDTPHQYSAMFATSAPSNGERVGIGVGGEPYVTGLPSLDVMKDLIGTLFSNNSYMSEFLHQASFRRQFAAGTLPPLLLYSALGSAARYSKNPAVRTDPPYNACMVFMNKAKTLVMDAIEEPCLGNAQGLMILCMMHFCLGNETITTFYKTMALNMCILLGYNRLDSVDGIPRHSRDCDPIATAINIPMDWVEREAARRLWWTIFSIENYSSVCLGMPPSIQAEYCDVNLPASALEWNQENPGSADDISSPKRTRISENPIHQLTAYHAQLSLIFSKIAALVTRTNMNSEDVLSEFGELNSVLQRWYEGLPKELRLSSVNTVLFGQTDPKDYYQICVLHMRFYTTVIQLNHSIPEFTDDPLIIEPGQRKCVMAASRISDLLRTSFEIPIEVRDMNWYMCVFRAAHIHIYRLLSRDSESITRAKQDLAVHRRHLREGGSLWRICYKLLGKLDDMEQMVMLLPAQIPVADLVRLKKLTRKGKSQLVNMQLDALIKPSLIQAGNGESEDLPLLTRTEIAQSSTAGRGEAAVSSSLHSITANGLAMSKMGVRAANGVTAAAAALSGQQPSFITPGTSISGIATSATAGLFDSYNGGPGSTGSVLAPFTPVSAHPQINNRASIDVGHMTSAGEQQFNSLNGRGAGGVAAAPSTSPPLILPSFEQQQQQQQQHNQGKFTSPSLMPALSAPALPAPQGVTPINTNLVIDNNMAETLVNYFYMVASNQSQSQAESQASVKAEPDHQLFRSPSLVPTANAAAAAASAIASDTSSICSVAASSTQTALGLNVNGLQSLSSLSSPQTFLPIKDPVGDSASNGLQQQQQFFSNIYNASTL